MSSKSEILENAREVAKRAEELVAYLEKNNFEEPSFKATSSVVPNNPEYDELRISVSNAAENLIHLVNGPLNWLRELFCMHYDFAAWQVALDFEYFKAVPLEGSIKLAEIAKTVGMDEERTGRILRLLATQKTFYEVEPDVFQHTAVSALIAKDHSIHAVLAMQADEMFKASVDTTACFREAPFDSDTKITPFKFRHGLPAYAWYTANPEKGARFALAMAGVTKMDRQISELKESFPWSSLTGTKIVDVGGGSGHISAYLASQFPQFKFVVQDISENMLAQASKDGKLEGVEDRISFMQHDFFQPQPIQDATAFFLRQITHNYNDIDTIRLFRGFVPAMEKCAPGTPLLVNDTVLPEANEKPAFEEHTLRQVDICMLVGYGAKQRTPKEFLKLLKEADDRFIIAKIHATGSMGLIEVHLQQ